MSLRSGGLIIGFLCLFGSISNLELLGARGQASCGKYLLFWCSFIAIVINKLIGFDFFFSDRSIGMECMDLWHL